MTDAGADAEAAVSTAPPFHVAAPAGTCWIAVAAVATCLGASLLLALAHVRALDLPGCGPASDCTRAAASSWGRLPGTDWPLAFVGFAYFQAVAAALVDSLGRLPRWLGRLIVAGGIASVVLTGVMIVEGYLCGYCLTVHVGNLVLAAVCVRSLRQASAPTEVRAALPVRTDVRSLVVFAGTFVAASLLAALVQRQSTAAAQERTRSELDQALRAPAVATAETTAFAPGRYVLGAADAPVRVTVVSDYQCPSCRVIDAQLRALTAGRADVAITARHFPFCTDCNPHVDRTTHTNACRAALAAEAAGQAGGADAFWHTHDWLFTRGGVFTDDELRWFVAELPLDWPAFQAAFQADATLDLIRADVAAADAAGLKFTPMLFINGAPLNLAPAP